MVKNLNLLQKVEEYRNGYKIDLELKFLALVESDIILTLMKDIGVYGASVEYFLKLLDETLKYAYFRMYSRIKRL